MRAFRESVERRVKQEINGEHGELQKARKRVNEKLEGLKAKIDKVKDRER
jgi:ABC-type phosphate transport system auxiliary subunit